MPNKTNPGAGGSARGGRKRNQLVERRELKPKAGTRQADLSGQSITYFLHVDECGREHALHREVYGKTVRVMLINDIELSWTWNKPDIDGEISPRTPPGDGWVTHDTTDDSFTIWRRTPPWKHEVQS